MAKPKKQKSQPHRSMDDYLDRLDHIADACGELRDALYACHEDVGDDSLAKVHAALKRLRSIEPIQTFSGDLSNHLMEYDDKVQALAEEFFT